jgi:hypothetical protein
MWFIGQKVVCINDRFPQRILEWTSDLPRKGRIYTIRSMARGKSIYPGESKLGFKLAELQSGRIGFFVDRFAPLTKRLDQACQRNASELTSPPLVEIPVAVESLRHYLRTLDAQQNQSPPATV